MYWLIGGIVLFVAFRVWLNRSIVNDYEEMISEMQEERAGELTEVYLSHGEYVKYKHLKDWEADLSVLWKNKNEKGFPVDFNYTKKNGNIEERKVKLTAVVQDSRNQVYFLGVDRTKGEDRYFDVDRIDSNISLPHYKKMKLDEFMETVCGLQILA